MVLRVFIYKSITQQDNKLQFAPLFLVSTYPSAKSGTPQSLHHCAVTHEQ